MCLGVCGQVILTARIMVAGVCGQVILAARIMVAGGLWTGITHGTDYGVCRDYGL